MSDPVPGRALRIPILIAAILVGCSAIVLARHYKRPAPPQETPAPGMTVGSDSITLAGDAPMWSVVKVAAAEPAQPRWTDPVPGRIAFDEARTSRVGAPLAGRVTAVQVERGQRVARGDRLFTVSSGSLAELRADLEKATTRRATARINFDRTRTLVDAGSLPAKELVSAQQEVTEAELAVKLAGQKLASLTVTGAGDAAFTVTAPRDGVVVEKSVSVGQNIDTTASVMAIADLSDVWAVADLFETDAGGLGPGTRAKVLLGTAELDGAIDQVSAVIDPDRHTLPVRVKLKNPDGRLRPNAYAELRFFDPATAAAQLPASAVLSDGATSYVYVKERGGVMRRRNIAVGPPSGGVVPVLSGLAPGEPVVVQGAILLDNQLQLDH